MTTSAATDVLLERARAWAAEDPDDATPGRARADHRRRGGRRRPGRPGRPVRRHPGVRDRRAARGGRRRAQPDEPGRGDPRRGRAGGVPARAGRDRPGRRRVRRAAPQRRLRPRHRRGDDRRRLQGLGAAAAAADAGAGLRDPRARLRGRRHGHREPQPAPGQRLQGLPRRRQPDRAAGGRRDRGPDRRGRRAGRRAPRAPAGPCSASTSWTATSTPSPSSPRTGRATSTSSTRRCTASAARRCCRCSRPPGFAAPRVVEQQEQPDPDFPTVAVPQPGGAGRDGPRAWRWPRSTAPTWSWPTTRTPTAAPPRSRPGHGWRMLRGDEVGALLAHHLMSRGRTGTWATSIVSSSLLGRMAAAAGQPYVETLTGFKWIGRVPGLAFGYEEALGYCCDPDHVKDKDGVSALLLLCELAAETKAAGRTLVDVLDDLAAAARPARHRPGLGAGGRPVPDRGRDGAAARDAADRAGRAGGRAGRRPLARQRRPAAHRRAAVPPRRRRPGRRPARAAPSRSSSATSRWSSRSTSRPASTRRGSRPRPGWTRWAPTPWRPWALTRLADAGSRADEEEHRGRHERGDLRPGRLAADLLGQLVGLGREPLDAAADPVLVDRAPGSGSRRSRRSSSRARGPSAATSPRSPPICSRARCTAEPFIAWRRVRPTPAQT